MGPKGRSSHRASSAPVVESLERRVLLSTFMVTNTSDAGAGTLRGDILMSNAAGGANTITFAAGLRTRSKITWTFVRW